MAGMMAPPDDMAMQADGNMQEVPPGSLPHEVADDIDAKLSEGEFVVPADVVRWHGLKSLMAMRDEAKQGLAAMDADGQIGGGLGAPDPIEAAEHAAPPSGGLMGFAEGGVVPGSRESLADQAAGGTRFAHQQVDWDGTQFVPGNLGYKAGDPTAIAQQGQAAAEALNKYVADNHIDPSRIDKGTAGTLFFNNAGRNVSARDLYDSVVGSKLSGLMAPTAAAAPQAAPPPVQQGPIQSSVNVPAPEQSTTPGALTYDKQDNHFAQTPYTPEQFAAKEQQFTDESAVKKESDARAAREAEDARRRSAYQAGQGQYNNPTTGLGGATQPATGPTTQLPQQSAGASMADAYSKLGQSLSNQSLGTAPNGTQLYTPYSGMVQMPQAQYQQLPQQRFAAGGLAAPRAPEVYAHGGGAGDDSTHDATHGAGTHEYDDNMSFMDNMEAFGSKVAEAGAIAGTLTSPIGAMAALGAAAATGMHPIDSEVGASTFGRSTLSNLSSIARGMFGYDQQTSPGFGAGAPTTEMSNFSDIGQTGYSEDEFGGPGASDPSGSLSGGFGQDSFSGGPGKDDLSSPTSSRTSTGQGTAGGGGGDDGNNGAGSYRSGGFVKRPR